LSNAIYSWGEARKNKRFVFQFITILIAILLLVTYLPEYFHSVIGPKQGVQLNDFILNLLPPQDHSWVIFGLIYLSLVITLQGITKQPLTILLGLTCYLAITLLRMLTMYLFTLEPPAGILLLHDPIVDVVAYGGVVFSKDLFFSGHVATLTLFALLEQRPALKKLLIVNSVVVAGLILLQHVHYTIDVVAAPLIMIGVYKLMKKKFLIRENN
jgi:PAP2 superfamily C-terminal